MILPLTLPVNSSPGSPALPSALARLGSSELFLLELQGELEVSGDKHGQLVGRLTIDDDDGKVRPPITSHFSSLFDTVYLIGQADAADRSSSLRGKDRQLAQAAGRAAARVCAITTDAGR
jgi:hypothetical protein